MVSLNLPGVGSYDASIAQAVIKVQVNVLLTSNLSGFKRLGEDVTQLLVRLPV